MYETFYGLSFKPFEVVPDPAFLYFSRSHLEALNAMLSGIRERRGLVVITGEVGTGKTTLVHYLLESLDKKVKTAFLFHSTVTFEELVESILLDLDRTVSREADAQGLWNQLLQYLGEASDRGETVAVMIDEAQGLSDAVLEELLEKCLTIRSGLMQMILLGQPELEEKLRSKHLKKFERQIMARVQVKPLDEEQAKKYVLHRLGLAGKRDSSPFAPEALSLICRHAGGVPRVINILCDNALLTGYGLSREIIDADIVEEVARDMEGRELPRGLRPGAESLPKVPPSRPGLNVPAKRIFLGVALFCLLGLILFTVRHLGLGPSRTSGVRTPGDPYPETPPEVRVPGPPPQEPEAASKERMLGESHEANPPSADSDDSVRSPADPLAAGQRAREGEELEKRVVVREGENITSLVWKHYRSSDKTLLGMVLDSNPQIVDIDLIRVDQQIRLPKVTDESFLIRSPDGSYKVHAGTYWTPEVSRAYGNLEALKGKRIETVPRKVSPRETWYRVMIEKFETRDEALAAVDLLKKKGLLFPQGQPNR